MNELTASQDLSGDNAGNDRSESNPGLARVDVRAASTPEVLPGACKHKRQSDQEPLQSPSQSPVELVFVKFGSHRARDYGFRALTRKPQGFYSWQRRLGNAGVYAVTEQEITQMRAYSGHARFTRVRGPHTDLMECWSWAN